MSRMAKDLDYGDLGGDFTWRAPQDLSHVTQYSVYLAEDSKGTKRSAVQNVPVGTNKVLVVADTRRFPPFFPN